MNNFRKTALTVLIVCSLQIPTAVLADTENSADHATHHSQTSSEPAPAMCTELVKKMQEIHTKIMSTKTLDERKKLLAEQREQMQSMMATMNEMMAGSGTMGKGENGNTAVIDRNMIQRIDMMQQMMQGMMDQQSGPNMMGR
ncbi:MAG: hypothetical protein KGI82_00115 [Betaproteobacteria bacterium]|nr:hypothetical protein [Betaproteobacteria bacterium]